MRRNAAPAWATGSQVVTSAGNFLTSVIIIHAAGLAEFGRFSVAFIILMITRNYLNALVLVPMSTIGPKLLATSARAYRGFLLANAAGFCLLTSVLLYALASVLGRLIGSPWLPDIALAMACANAAANLADFVRRYLLIGLGPWRGFALDCLRYLVQLPLLLAAGDVFGTLDARTALAILALGSLVAAAYGMFHYGGMRWRPLFARSVWPRHWNFIKWMAPSVSLEAAQGPGPLFIGALLLGDASLGAVRAIHQITSLLNLPANSAMQVAPSMAAMSYRTGGIAAMRRLLRSIGLATGAFVVLSSVPLLLAWPFVSQTLFRLDGPTTVGVLAAFCAANLLTTLRIPLLSYFYVAEKPHLQAKSLLASAAAAVLLTPALTIPLGPIGVPLAILLSLALSTAILWTLARRLRLR